MPWPASSALISPTANRPPATAVPARSWRPSARLARANTATRIASHGSNGGWAFGLNMVTIQAPEQAVTKMATATGARNRQHSGTVTSSRNPAWAATGPGKVTLLAAEDRLPFCARLTAPRAMMASGTSHQETADHSRSTRSMPGRYARSLPCRLPLAAERRWPAIPPGAEPMHRFVPHAGGTEKPPLAGSGPATRVRSVPSQAAELPQAAAPQPRRRGNDQDLPAGRRCARRSGHRSGHRGRSTSTSRPDDLVHRTGNQRPQLQPRFRPRFRRRLRRARRDQAHAGQQADRP